MSHQKLTPREKRKVRVRRKICGTAERPRLSIFRSNRYLYAQIIDDLAQKTLVSVSSAKESQHPNKTTAKKVGKIVADKALQNKIEAVVFDRNGYQFHGVVKEFADAARAAGLKF